jgi:UDP-N-acetylmuramoyl-L-alanyl-D-glutamate--2,6-diaminopimelate ligase
MLTLLKKLIPAPLFNMLSPAYHFLLSFSGALRYGFPTKRIFVIGITGTKGKTTVAELINAVLEEGGQKTALAGTLRFKIGEVSKPNLHKMTMPGRFFLQKFFSDAVRAGCTHAVVEMTSEGAKQFRHRFIALDALIFTNLEPEHIERHGSYEKYVAAKVDIAKQLLRGGKDEPMFIGNGDDAEIGTFESVGIPHTHLYRLEQAKPYTTSKDGIEFTWYGSKIRTKLVGEFSIANCMAALTLAHYLGIPKEKAIAAIEKFKGVAGRLEEVKAGQNFTVIVDYAHTPKSLEALYRAYGTSRKICVLSGTGGGRDKWKRPLMGEIASEHCDSIILTDEDPYDENPRAIVEEIKKGIRNQNVEIELNRRAAISKAFSKAKEGDVVFITGKGTDPYIMGPKGSKIPWSDSRIAKEELEKLGFKS